MQNHHYPLMLVIVYKVSTGTKFIHSEEEYFEFVRNLGTEIIAFYEAEAYGFLLLSRTPSRIKRR